MARALRERGARDLARATERAQAIRSRLPAAAACLRGHGARRVWLFGSIAEGRPRLDSDVDLAVEGLPPARYFDALAEVAELAGTRVDLVRWEAAPPSLRERVAECGVEL
ncbi:MAG: nucleotidyltransferase domain-containing protein [Myxococcales bacterium]|nr:nucleotidyltransferase domain-containing protein [Myxococcales bacterium]